LGGGLGGGDARERTREKKRIEEQTSRNFESDDDENTIMDYGSKV
jgi:hypothetical protein